VFTFRYQFSKYSVKHESNVRRTMQTIIKYKVVDLTN